MARKRPEYNSADFEMIRKPYQKMNYKTYEKYIEKFNKAKGAKKHTYKVSAKRHFPDQYKETDFPRKTTNFLNYTYQQLVQTYNQQLDNGKRNVYVSLIAKKRYPQEFNNKDFSSILKAKISDEEKSIFSKVFETTPIPPETESVLRRLVKKKILKSYTKPISDKEKDIFNMYLGINQPRSTFTIIGNKYKFTRSNASELFQETLEKLLMPRKMKNTHLSYPELIKAHSELFKTGKQFSYIKRLAKKYPEFKSSDFKRKKS
jgi:DNA-directed RNA polymerase sigma subunit (sigma70/sigma32)